MEHPKRKRKKLEEGKEGTLLPSFLVLLGDSRSGREKLQPLGCYVDRAQTSLWKLLLAGNCGSSTEPLEYIVFILAHRPIGALTRKEFLYHSSHNKEERERSRAGGRRSEVKGGEGKGAL